MITKSKVQKFRTDFRKAVSDLEKEYGIKIELKSITYSDVNFSTRMVCTEIEGDGNKKVDFGKFQLYKDIYGLKGNIGSEYKDTKGNAYTIVDLNTRSSKYPVIVKDSFGNQYKASVDYVNMCMARS